MVEASAIGCLDDGHLICVCLHVCFYDSFWGFWLSCSLRISKAIHKGRISEERGGGLPRPASKSNMGVSM